MPGELRVPMPATADVARTLAERTCHRCGFLGGSWLQARQVDGLRLLPLHTGFLAALPCYGGVQLAAHRRQGSAARNWGPSGNCLLASPPWV